MYPFTRRTHPNREGMDSEEAAGGCGMKILCLYSNECALELFQWLKEQGHETVLQTERLNAQWCMENHFDLGISYTYPYLIGTDVIDVLKGNIVNIHNSYLPFDRGTSPNLWNLLEGTPRGVSIHYIDKGLDTGDVIAQQIIELEEPATLRTSYEQLDKAAKTLFKKVFPQYRYWNCMRKKCIGEGTYHRERDFDKILQSFETWNWDIQVEEYIQKAREAVNK